MEQQVGTSLNQLRELQETGGMMWDESVYNVLNRFSQSIEVIEHVREHGTGEDCLQILNELGYETSLITPVVSQIGTIKLDGERKNVAISHMGVIFKDPIRKAAAIQMGTSGKKGKDFLPLDSALLEETSGFQYGASSPFIKGECHAKFQGMVIVDDKTCPEKKVAIAAGTNITLIMDRADFIDVCRIWAEDYANSNIKIINYPTEA